MMRSRREKSESGPAVSLFPFLAVLLCTMGVLIMFLVLIGQNTARDTVQEQSPVSATASEPDPWDTAFYDMPEEETAAQTASMAPLSIAASDKEPIPERALSEPVSEPVLADTSSPAQSEVSLTYESVRQSLGGIAIDELQTEVENADWFRSELEAVQRRTEESIRTQRDRLAATEAEVAKMVERLVELNQELLNLEEGNSSSPQSEDLQHQIEEKISQISDLNREVEEMRERLEQTKDQKSYAILPYRGKSGTFRHPIYIECDASGVHIMPEGVSFLPEDFLLAKYAGNPFDAAIRAARQYYIEIGQGTETDEPYPLLVVRPGGATAYYCAMNALASWGGEYGYEFVENDADISYPASDPELRNRVTQQMLIARSRFEVQLAALLAQQNAAERQRLTEPGGEEFWGDPNLGKDVSGLAANGVSFDHSATGFASLQSQLGPYARVTPAQGRGNAVANGGNGDLNSSSMAGMGGGYSGGLGASTVSAGLGAGGSSLPGGSDKTGNPGTGSRLGGDSPMESGSDSALYAAGSALPTSETQGGESSLSGNASSASASAQNGLSYGYAPATSGAPEASDTAQPASFLVQAAQMPEKSNAKTSEEESSVAATDPLHTIGNTATMRTAPEGGREQGRSVADNPLAPSPKTQPASEKTAKEFKSSEDNGAFNIKDKLYQKSDQAMERPILVQCYSDRIVIPVQPGLRRAKEIPLAQGCETELFQTIIMTVQAWGVAGRGQYWAPWIKAQTASDAAQTYAWLDQLMRSQQIRILQVE